MLKAPRNAQQPILECYSKELGCERRKKHRVPVMEHKVCSLCGQPGEALRRCTGCWHVPYCSRDCQLRDWPRHKRTCCKGSSPSTGGVQPLNVLSTEKSAVKSTVKEDGNDLSAASEIVCKTCKNPRSTAAVKCTRCQEVTYCSRDCRRADWLKHMVTCVPAPTTKDQEKKTQESSSDAKPSTPPLEVPGTESIPTGENDAAGISSHAKPAAEERVECDGEEVKTCLNCKTKKTNMKRCARCQEVTYCSRDCQSAHWPGHKVTCRPIEVVTTDGYRETARREEVAKRKQEAEANDLANPLLSYLSLLSTGMIRTGTTMQRFNWQEARYLASKEFPGKRIVDDFKRLDSDFSGLPFFLRPALGRKDVVALCHLTGFIPHPFWPAWGVEDIEGTGARAIFYWDYDTDFYFFLRDGPFLCIEGAYLHLFEDGSVGFKVFDPSSIRVIDP